ncbi:hypothetical protein ACP70R_030702 [Stipagrostis hirtigluma subsp. patula]
MGNMLPCLVQQGAALPAMNSKQRLVSLKLLVKALHKMKMRPGSNKAKIHGSKSSSSSSSLAAAAEGGELEVVRGMAASSNPKSAMMRSRLHRSGQKKGVVRVKVVLTKEEAARLLTLTVGGHNTAAQIVAEIKKMEARRANGGAPAWRPALASIPEES